MDSMHEEIAAAVRWWADQLTQPPVHDNGDLFQSALASSIAATYNKPIEPEKIEKFVELLTAGHVSADQAHDLKRDRQHSDWYNILGVDYGPDWALKTALEGAGIDQVDSRFPYKTVMWINPGCVKVRNGYGHGVEYLYGHDTCKNCGAEIVRDGELWCCEYKRPDPEVSWDTYCTKSFCCHCPGCDWERKYCPEHAKTKTIQGD